MKQIEKDISVSLPSSQFNKNILFKVTDTNKDGDLQYSEFEDFYKKLARNG